MSHPARLDIFDPSGDQQSDGAKSIVPFSYEPPENALVTVGVADGVGGVEFDWTQAEDS